VVPVDRPGSAARGDVQRKAVEGGSKPARARRGRRKPTDLD